MMEEGRGPRCAKVRIPKPPIGRNERKHRRTLLPLTALILLAEPPISHRNKKHKNS